MTAMPATDETSQATADGHGLASALCSPERLRARVAICGDLYRGGRITRAEMFRIEVDASVGQDSGPVEFEENNDHEFMMTGEGPDHDEYRRREAFRLANT